MEFSIEALKSAGDFVGAPVRKEITVGIGENQRTYTVYVRLDSFHTITQRWEGQEQGSHATAQRIATSICDKAGMPVLTVADILGDPATGHGPLSSDLTVALLAAIHEANGIGGEGAAEKKSKRPKSSGTTSS